MEFKEIRSSVFAKTMRFNGKLRAFERPNQHKGFAEKVRAYERQSQHKGLINKSDSGFKVIPRKELCSVYLHKPTVLASKGIIDARAKPPHNQKHGEAAKKRTFDQQNFNLRSKKLRHYTNVEKKESSQRRFSPLGFGSDSQLRESGRKGQYIITPEKKKLKKTTLVQKKDVAVREAGSKLIVSTSRDSVLSLERNRFAQDVKFRHVSSSSSGFVSKDESEDSSDCSNASSPGCQEEAHQPSPVSVLEPIFNDHVLEDDSEELPYLEDLHGIEKQLDDLKTESDSYSDGSGMEVSSDEESDIASETEESKKSEPIMLLDSQERRESSYIDDILSEVSLMDKLDSVLTFKVFEKMEKRYYTETSWKRSERRILFDRVSSGLVEILESFTATPTWRKPVSRRLVARLSICELKQELCKVLAKQEKRANKVSFNKVPVIDLDEWLELEAGDDESVVCELESMIVDELMFEVFM